MSDSVFIALIIALLVVVVVCFIIIMRMMKPKVDREIDVKGGGVDTDSGLFTPTGDIGRIRGDHTGTIVAGVSDRIKLTIYNCNTNEERVLYIVRETRIGRQPSYDPADPNAYFITNDEMVSSNHCSIWNYGGMPLLVDNHSSNHTYLNGQMLTSSQYLNSGDEIFVGQTRLIVNIS